MAGEQMLLRMLEPAVRPAGAPAPGVQPHEPIERQSFDQLLRDAASFAEARAMQGVTDAEAEPASQAGNVETQTTLSVDSQTAASPADQLRQAADATRLLMQQLSQTSNIDNPSLLNALTRATSTGQLDDGDLTVRQEVTGTVGDRP